MAHCRKLLFSKQFATIATKNRSNSKIFCKNQPRENQRLTQNSVLCARQRGSVRDDLTANRKTEYYFLIFTYRADGCNYAFERPLILKRRRFCPFVFHLNRYALADGVSFRVECRACVLHDVYIEMTRYKVGIVKRRVRARFVEKTSVFANTISLISSLTIYKYRFIMKDIRIKINTRI